MKDEEFDVDTNKTGLALSPYKEEMLENSEIMPGSAEELSSLVEQRSSYIEESGPIGSIPPPASLKQVAKSAVDLAKGNISTTFMDKLGARLAFERSGTRLYEAFIEKLEVLGPVGDAPDPTLVKQFYREELSHMELVRQAIVEMGGDPTAVTPAANVDGVAFLGLLQVITDPRTDVAQSLHAIHIAELADNDGWEMLTGLAETLGKAELVRLFLKALEEEKVHLKQVRTWLNQIALEESKVE